MDPKSAIGHSQKSLCAEARQLLVRQVLHRNLCKNYLPPNHPLRLVACVPRAVADQPLADWNLRQANILHHGPDDRHTTGFRREDINLIGALPHIAKQAFNRIGAANVAMHDGWKGIKGQHMLFIFE